jgi:hypothetical protein
MKLLDIQVDSKTIRMLIGSGDEPQFVAQDIAELLGYKQYISNVDSICKKVTRLRDYNTEIKNIDIRARLIVKSDIYRLVANSKLSDADKIYCNLLKQIDKEVNIDEKSTRTLDPSAHFILISETIELLETCSKVLENLAAYNEFNCIYPVQKMTLYNLSYVNNELVQHSNRLINIRSKIIKFN